MPIGMVGCLMGCITWSWLANSECLLLCIPIDESIGPDGLKSVGPLCLVLMMSAS